MPVRLGRVLAVLFILPLFARLIWFCADFLGQAGESAAFLSAVLAMPEGGVPLLRERFRAEIYNPEGDHATGDSEQGTALPPQGELQPESSFPSAVPDEELPSPDYPTVADEYAAPIISEDFSGRNNPSLVSIGAGLLKNETAFEKEEILDILATPYPIAFEDTDEPQVLLVHTHATEAFEQYDSPTYDIRGTWRSTDNKNNMVAVGDAFAQVLEQNGIAVIHDTTQHDHPSYNGSYERSAETIRDYLDQYPSIKVVLDLHRDAMQRDDAIVKPVAVIDGKKAAQLMIISACDNGSLGVPEWRENLRFAAAFQNQVEAAAPGLTRPLYFCHRKYNMDLTTGSLLLEFGSNANTLDESIYSATIAAQALADLIRDNINTPQQEETLH